MSNSLPDATPKELFEAVGRMYDQVCEEFREFFLSPMGEKYKDALGHFIHESHRQAGNVSFALQNGLVPKPGRPDMRWGDYNATLANIRLMELILELYHKEDRK